MPNEVRIVICAVGRAGHQRETLIDASRGPRRAASGSADWSEQGCKRRSAVTAAGVPALNW